MDGYGDYNISLGYEMRNENSNAFLLQKKVLLPVVKDSIKSFAYLCRSHMILDRNNVHLLLNSEAISQCKEHNFLS